jgi:hypothetical protein
MQNPKKYGFMLREKDLYSMPNYKIIEVDSTISDLSIFANSHNVNYKLLKQFNPWLRTTSLPDKSRRRYLLKILNETDLFVFDDIQVAFDSLK